jgi:hypothetical protein
MGFDYERDRLRFELEDAQIADLRFRRYLLGALRPDGVAPMQRDACESALADVDRRIALRALRIADIARTPLRSPSLVPSSHHQLQATNSKGARRQ